MVLIFSKIARFAFIYFFPIIMIDYYLVMRGFNFNTVIVYPLIAVLFVWSIKFILIKRNDFIVSLLNVFLIYNLLSIVAYFFNNTPIDCYIGSFRNFIFPFIQFFFPVVHFCWIVRGFAHLLWLFLRPSLVKTIFLL